MRKQWVISIFCIVSSFVFANIAHAQLIAETDDTQIRSSFPPQGDPNVAPPPWTRTVGNCDTSNEQFWGQGNGTNGWVSPPPPIPIPGHDHFMSCSSVNLGGETVRSSITGLIPGQEYEFTFYVAGFRTTNSGNGAGVGTSYRVIIGDEDSGSVQYNYTDSWIEQVITFIADATSEFIFISGSTEGAAPGRLTHFSFSENAVVRVATELTLEKTVINDDGGVATESDFILGAFGPINLVGVQGSAAVTGATVVAGNYQIKEAGPDGYDLTSIACTGTADADISDGLDIVEDEIVTCTLTNNDSPPPTGGNNNGLSISKTSSSNVSTAGVAFDYVITVSNTNGDGSAHTNVVVTDTLDSGLTCNSVTPSGSGTTSGCATTVTCTWLSIADGASETCTINVTP